MCPFHVQSLPFTDPFKFWELLSGVARAASTPPFQEFTSACAHERKKRSMGYKRVRVGQEVLSHVVLCLPVLP